MFVHHLTVRCDGGRFRLDDDTRRLYLRTLGAVLARSDWRLLSYCLMSSHVHLGAEAGRDPIDDWLVPLHATVERAAGDPPLWASRYEVVIAEDARFASHMISYQHNNPVRAGVANTAWDSAWSSHRAYLRLAPRPAWLDARCGLALCGLPDDAVGRSRFDETTHRRSLVRRDHWLSPEHVTVAAAGTRTLLRCPDATPLPIPAPGDTRPESKPAALREPVPVPITREHARGVPMPTPR